MVDGDVDADGGHGDSISEHAAHDHGEEEPLGAAAHTVVEPDAVLSKPTHTH